MGNEDHQCRPGDDPAALMQGPTAFERLREVSELHYDDQADQDAYQKVLDQIAECGRLVTQYEQTNGYHSQEIRSAITEWAQKYRSDLKRTEDQLTKGHQYATQARDVMRNARDTFLEKVSPELLSPAEEKMKAGINVGTTVMKYTIPISGYLVDVAADKYWEWLEGERKDKREQFCDEILKKMNHSLNETAGKMESSIDQGKTTGDEYNDGDQPAIGGSMPGLGGADGGLPGGGLPGGGLPGGGPGAGGYDPGALGGGPGADGLGADGLGASGALDGSGADDPYAARGADWMSEGFNKPGVEQAAPPRAEIDDLDGVGLIDRPINQTVTPNGLVGGYAPPSSTDFSDPKWDPSYKIPSSVTDAGKAASAGALGAVGGMGAAGALKGLGGAAAGMSAKSLMAGGAGAAGAGTGEAETVEGVCSVMGPHRERAGTGRRDPCRGWRDSQPPFGRPSRHRLAFLWRMVYPGDPLGGPSASAPAGTADHLPWPAGRPHRCLLA